MRRFIIISLLVAVAMPSLPCAWVETHNYYLFSAYDGEEFRERIEKVCNANWKAYLGIGENEWYSFDAQQVIQAAQQKGDVLMASYARNLDKYLGCAQNAMRSSWNYPTKEELAQDQRTLKDVRAYAATKTRSRLRSQHALLYMRCNMMLGLHQENIGFWQQTASQYPKTIYKDMMKNIYAGALLKTGNEDRAGELFAEMGDYASLMTQYYQRRSYQAIREQYRANPNAAVLPFLLQDFVNNAQEAVDAKNGAIAGKLFIRNIQQQESWQMRQFCKQVVREGASQTPVLWQSAKAWLEYLAGNKQQALNDIEETARLQGTERMKDNARMLKLYITAAQAPQSETFDNYLAGELQWLKAKQQECGHYRNMEDRLTHQVLAGRYAGSPVMATALLNAAGTSEYTDYIDTMRVEQLERYRQYIDAPARTPLDRYVKAHMKNDPQQLDDLIGTKHMRLCQWGEAIQWLAQIPADFYSRKGYAVYAANRNYTIAPWMKRQRLGSLEYSGRQWQLQSNPKLDFAREMQQMEGQLSVLSGDALNQCYYDLAIRYAQASFTGDCWYLMRDGKSVNDNVRRNEKDLAALAASMLHSIRKPRGFEFQEQVLFGLTYSPLSNSPWFTMTYNSERSDYDFVPHPDSQQYQRLAALAAFERKNAGRTSQYVSRCDNYATFLKHYR